MSIRKRFDQFLTPEAESSHNSLFTLFVFAASILAVVFLTACIIAFLGKDAGSFGDFFGGVVNPLLTFLTFMGLLLTIVLQQAELRETRSELKRSATALESQLKATDRQNFESTFFQMLTLHNTIVNSIDLYYSKRPTSKETKGRDCFKQFFENFRDEYHNSSALYEKENEKDHLQHAYDNFWVDRQQDLAHYYRYLYNVLRFVYDYEGIEDKVPYVKLLRAQLSDYELVLLFYTALNKHGINYWVYIHKYQLLDNLLPALLIDPTHKNLYSRRSFGEPKRPRPTSWPPSLLAQEYDEKKGQGKKSIQNSQKNVISPHVDYVE
ncbi:MULTISPECIES: putative phage abortive infection protein [unclassified Pseudovibrio]|uniref:putative phage abortive infection protein n=1 Tax=unclassified Pseudovibrio TaxID=2627060 RepID=UPI0007AE8907|nr:MULTISPECIES: putative phage abortive infection protein [unclassified Pseudovibrio]